jgi:hypothetical protein
MAARGWAALLLLFAVLAVHGLQCGSASDGAAHAGVPPVVSVAAPLVVGDAHHSDSGAHHSDSPVAHTVPLAAGHDAASAAVATIPGGDSGSAPHQGAGHLWAVCLAVLAAGLALLLALPGPRLTVRAPAAVRTPSRAVGFLPLPRPPDLHALCLLRT